MALVLPRRGISPEDVKASGACDVLVLDKASRWSGGHVAAVRKEYLRLDDVRQSNCSAAILLGRSAFLLVDRAKFDAFDLILVPIGIEMLAAGCGLLAYGRRRQLRFDGLVRLGRRTFIVLRTHQRDTLRPIRFIRARAPDALFRDLETTRYCALLHFSPDGRERPGEMPILIAGHDIDVLRERLSSEVCTTPVRLFADDGAGNHLFKMASYFMPHVADRILGSATVGAEGIRIASKEWQFLSFCYHILFHEPSAAVRPGTEAIEHGTFASAFTNESLASLAVAAGASVPRTFSDIERVLREASAFPGIDLIGFYMAGNPFLQHRYGSRDIRPGLISFYVRDYGQAASETTTIRERLAARFRIIAEGSLEGDARAAIKKWVRGGNWSDPGMPGGMAEPCHWFLCWDPAPRPPSHRTRAKSIVIDNENAMLKHELRVKIVRQGRSTQRVIHSSDCSAEALEHARLLGVGDLAERALGMPKQLNPQGADPQKQT